MSATAHSNYIPSVCVGGGGKGDGRVNTILSGTVVRLMRIQPCHVSVVGRRSHHSPSTTRCESGCDHFPNSGVT